MLRVASDYAQRSDTGRERRANEDSSLARPPLFVVADGMGGAQAGEVASRIAVESLAPGLPDGGSPEERLAELVSEANRRIHELSRADRARAGMGTTLTAAYVGEDALTVAHVGDSRAYLWRDGELTRLTRDHSLVDELVRRGKLTEEEAAEHPQRSIITRALGPEAAVEIDTRTHQLKAGDVILLCSDGLTSMIGEGELAATLASADRLDAAADALVHQANAAGGRDNITVVLFRIEDVAAGSPPAAEDQPTEVGQAVPAAGAAAEPAAPPAPAERRSPAPLAATQGRTAAGAGGTRRGPRRGVVAAIATLVVLALVLAGGWIASRSVFFLATDSHGLVTVYRGLPWDLPAGIHLYESYYVSGVPAADLSAARRKDLLDHRLRSQHDATNLVDQLELGKVSQ
jgi:protein phosphatase